jgi:hypothetical protein
LASAREFLRSLAGPHVLLGLVAGGVQGWWLGERSAALSGVAVAIPGVATPVEASHGAIVAASAALLSCAGAAAALLAKRLTGNTLASGCAGAVFALLPQDRLVGAPWLPAGFFLNDAWAAAWGLLAAGVRLLPAPALEGAPLLGRREWLALGALAIGSLGGPQILAMPLLILLADAAYAPASFGTVLRRTGRLLPLHALAVAPAFFMGPPSRGDDARVVAGWELAAVALLGLAVLSRRRRITQTVVIAAAFAIVWTAVATLPRFAFPRHLPFSPMLVLFGAALFVPTVLWRLSVALTSPRGLELVPEAPLPAVPALRDLIHAQRSDARAGAGPPSRRIDPATGLRSTVESAVSGAVAATLEQIRLTFRGTPASSAPLPAPEGVLWSRLLSSTARGTGSDETREQAIERWRSVVVKDLRPRVDAAADVVCAGSTPWPLVAALAERQRSLVLVERGAQASRRAADDLSGLDNVTVLRHDRGLGPLKDASADAVLALVEPTMDTAAGILALLRESRRVLRPGGVAGLGFADLAAPASQEALVKGSPSECFLNRPAVETLARLAGFGQFEFAPGVLPMTSVAWLRARKERG